MSSGPAIAVEPAANLVGVTLEGGWYVESIVDLPSAATGGNFSTGYIVRGPDGKKAFMKAMDYSRAFRGNPAGVAVRLQRITEQINHERELVRRCNLKRLRRVVTSLATGTYLRPGAAGHEAVEYLIFEFADSDVRRRLDSVVSLEAAWKLRALHNIAVGLTQLHANDIAHQDLKPSNVLVFDDENQKLADLGSASCRGLVPPHDMWDIAGDPDYAPVEFQYGYVPADWLPRRFGCDAYLLGSMIVYLFTRLCMTELLFSVLEAQYHPHEWVGEYQEVLPFLQDSFTDTLFLVGDEIPEVVRDDLVAAVRQLCHPSPALRGDPKAKSGRGNPYSLRRYVSLFDRLTRRCLLFGE